MSHRVRQPYDQWEIKYEMPEKETDETEYERKLRNYESDDYVHEDDFNPGLEGFLHNVKRLVSIFAPIDRSPYSVPS